EMQAELVPAQARGNQDHILVTLVHPLAHEKRLASPEIPNPIGGMAATGCRKAVKVDEQVQRAARDVLVREKDAGVVGGMAVDDGSWVDSQPSRSLGIRTGALLNVSCHVYLA